MCSKFVNEADSVIGARSKIYIIENTANGLGQDKWYRKFVEIGHSYVSISVLAALDSEMS